MKRARWRVRGCWHCLDGHTETVGNYRWRWRATVAAWWYRMTFASIDGDAWVEHA